jgi:hypothetical protein
MSIDAAPDLSVQSEQPIADPLPHSRLGKLLFAAFVLVMPVVAFWSTDLFWPEWQNGELESYLILLLSPKASWPFFPLLLYSIVCYLFLSYDFARYSAHFIIRFGIYTGVLLALQFSVLSGLYFFKADWTALLLVLLWILPILAARIHTWAVSRWDAKKVSTGWAAVSIVAFIAIAIIAKAPTAPIYLFLVCITVAAPSWCFLLYSRVSIWLIRNHEMQITVFRALGFAAWTGAYIFAWRVAILKMYELYAALPPEPPPDCYIATAAAQGHPQFVDSKVILRTDGTSLTVNRQLQILKFAELALMAVVPRMHKALRKVYDVIGRFVARKIKNPFLADFAYLMLSPFEMLAAFLLRRLLPQFDELTRQLYTK